MGFIDRRKKKKQTFSAVQTACTERRSVHPFTELNGYVPLKTAQHGLYAAMREAIPIIDAAILKTVRLVGDFTVKCQSVQVQRQLGNF